MTEWYTIQNYNKHLSYEANKENGVELPLIDSDVLVIYPDISTINVFPKIATEYGMTGTDYYDGTMWAYFDMPKIPKQ